GSSLECYSCTSKLSNSQCQTKKTCGAKEECKTDVIRFAGLFSVINKGCDSSCVTSYENLKVANRNITCCSSDLCNENAAGSVRSSYGLAGGVAAGVLWTILNNK
ncbi:PSCA protein, partial [Leptocoma aspasia]|nr:PSCA protein [Leptocoma aspasia]